MILGVGQICVNQAKNLYLYSICKHR